MPGFCGFSLLRRWNIRPVSGGLSFCDFYWQKGWKSTKGPANAEHTAAINIGHNIGQRIHLKNSSSIIVFIITFKYHAVDCSSTLVYIGQNIGHFTGINQNYEVCFIQAGVAQSKQELVMTGEPIYTRVPQMEPMFPAVQDTRLNDLAVEVIRQSAALRTTLHPTTRKSVVALVRSMNSYYSNLIEGHHTHPADIERALVKDYSHDPAKRALQMESAAHVEVQRLIEVRLAEEVDTDICAPGFLCWIHREFYDRLPEEYRRVKNSAGELKVVRPGELREDEVTVGTHLAPGFRSLPDFLARFHDSYGNPQLSEVDKVIAVAASHHRLAWIHPFLDGNGRVTRLFSHAYLVKARIDGHGIWTVSRGLARNRTQYLAALAGADHHRQGDRDGRGNLSNHGLVAFCDFFLEMALDQIKFMLALLDFDGLQKRIMGYVARQTALGELQPESGYLLREVLLRGEVPRGEAPRITGKAERTARRILKDLLEKKLLSTETEKGPVHLSFPARAVGYYFPRLYPEGVELGDD